MSDFNTKDLHTLNHLIHKLYSEGPVDRRLSDFLHQLFTVIFFDKAAIYFFRKNGDHFSQTHAIEYNVTSDYIDASDYYRYYEPYDDLFSSVNAPVPCIIRFSEYYDFEARLENPAWREFYIPSNIYYGINGNILFKSQNNLKAGICLYREKTRNDFSDKDIEILRFLQPHLSKALHYYGEEQSLNNSCIVLSNSSHLAYALFNESLELVSCNNIYKELMSNDQYGSLLSEKVRSLCRQAFTDSAGLDNYSYESKLSDAPFFIELSKKASAPDSDILVQCLVYNISYLFDAALQQLRKEYTLTKREFDILQEILRGYSNEDIASHCYLSIPSVKKYTASAYNKLGIKSSKQILQKLRLQ